MCVTQKKGHAVMSNAAKREYLQVIRGRYLEGSKSLKRTILDEFCRVCGYNRKYAIRVLRAPVDRKSTGAHPGRPRWYRDPALLAFLKKLWISSNLVCSKRLKVMIALWLPHSRLSSAMRSGINWEPSPQQPSIVCWLHCAVDTPSAVWQPPGRGLSSKSISPSRPTNGMNESRASWKPIPLPIVERPWLAPRGQSCSTAQPCEAQ